MTDHELMTIDEVAKYLRVSERTVYDWANKQEIPCGKLGTAWRFKRVEIERWVDEKLTNKPAPAQPIAVGDVLTPERVIILDTNHKEDALNKLIDCIAEAPQIKNKDALAREIYQREELMSTGIGFNVAVPHVRLDSVTELVMAVGLCKQDITDYESLDEQPVRIICMVAARSDQHAQYLRTLGTVSAALKGADVRKALLKCENAKDAYAILVN